MIPVHAQTDQECNRTLIYAQQQAAVGDADALSVLAAESALSGSNCAHVGRRAWLAEVETWALFEAGSYSKSVERAEHHLRWLPDTLFARRAVQLARRSRAHVLLGQYEHAYAAQQAALQLRRHLTPRERGYLVGGVAESFIGLGRIDDAQAILGVLAADSATMAAGAGTYISWLSSEATARGVSTETQLVDALAAARRAEAAFEVESGTAQAMRARMTSARLLARLGQARQADSLLASIELWELEHDHPVLRRLLRDTRASLQEAQALPTPRLPDTKGETGFLLFGLLLGMAGTTLVRAALVREDAPAGWRVVTTPSGSEQMTVPAHVAREAQRNAERIWIREGNGHRSLNVELWTVTRRPLARRTPGAKA